MTTHPPHDQEPAAMTSEPSARRGLTLPEIFEQIDVALPDQGSPSAEAVSGLAKLTAWMAQADTDEPGYTDDRPGTGEEQPERVPHEESGSDPATASNKTGATRDVATLEAAPTFWHRLARWSRALAGVDEDVLAFAPYERPRYNALACTVIATSWFAGLSMYFALSETIGTSRGWYVLPAVIWSLFMLSLDRWLIWTPPARSHGFHQALKALPRVVVVLLLSIITAVPLVLHTFQPSIEAQVRLDRQNAISTWTNELTLCNPASGKPPLETPRNDKCSMLALSITNQVPVDEQRLQSLQEQWVTLKAEMDQESTQLTQLEQITSEECNGAAGPGLTGRAGDGPACQHDKQLINDFLASKPLTLSKQYELVTSLEDEIKATQSRLSVDTANFTAARDTKIRQQVRSLPQPEESIGLLDRLTAFREISAPSKSVLAAGSLLVAILALFKVLPVLLKQIDRASLYERIARKKADEAERAFAASLEAQQVAAALRSRGVDFGDSLAGGNRKLTGSSGGDAGSAVAPPVSSLRDVDR